GIKFQQDPELPDGISRRSLPIVDQGTLKQGTAINPVSTKQQYPVEYGGSLGKQVLSTAISAGTITMSSPSKELVRCPPPEPTSNIGPAQYMHELTHLGGLPAHREQKGIKFRQDPELPEGMSKRSLPVVDQGTLKQGMPVDPVSYEQQYPVKFSGSMGKQVLSTSKSAGSITMSSPSKALERCPPPEPTSDIGPAQFCHELTHLGGLPAHREQKGIKFRQDPELPEGMSKRSLPVVDQGTLKQGAAVGTVDPYQQYPVAREGGMGRQVQSRYRTSGSVTMGRGGTRSGALTTGDPNGPAMFNTGRNISGERTGYGESAGVRRTVSRGEAERKGRQLFEISKPKNDSVRQWLEERDVGDKGEQEGGKIVKQMRGNKRLESKMNWTWDGQPRMKPATGAQKKKGGKGSGAAVSSVADWLENNGLPGKDNIFKAEFERRKGTKAKGHVQPTFISLATHTHKHKF
ncbi:hypothetical protein TeGR_g5088, partial [Tetraparma gracilis]